MTHHIALLIRLFKVLSPFHKAIYINTVAIITSQGIRTFSIAQSAFAINSLIAGEIHSAYIHLAIALGLGFTDMIITYFNDHYQVYAYDFSLYNHLQEYSLRNIFKLNISQFYEDHSALKLTVVQRGEMSIQYFTESIFNTLLPTVSMMVFALGAIFWYSPTAAAITLGVFAVTFIMVWKFTEYMRPLQKQNMDAWDEQQKVRAESFQHLPLIKTLGSTDRFIRAYIDNRESLTTLSKRIQVIAYVSAQPDGLYFELHNLVSLHSSSGRHTVELS